jgi:hypothetical protein
MLAPSRQWALALGGLLTHRNGQSLSLLGGVPRTPEAGADLSKILARDWGASNRDELLAALEFLMGGGHRKEFNDICALANDVTGRLTPGAALDDLVDDEDTLRKVKFAIRHRQRVGARSLLAWDVNRVVVVAGWGFVTGMISEDEAWSYIMPMAYAAQQTYASWEEYGQHHLLGREYWAGSWEGRFARGYRSLLDDPSSPWRTLAWRSDLSQPPVTTAPRPLRLEAPPPPSASVAAAMAHVQGPGYGLDQALQGAGVVSATQPEPLARSGGGSGAKIAIFGGIGLVVLIAAGVGIAFATGMFDAGGGGSARPASTAAGAATSKTPAAGAAAPRGPAPAKAPPAKSAHGW